MDTAKKDIAKNIELDDAALNVIIQEYLDGRYYHGPATTVLQWRIDNADDLRQWMFKTKDAELADATGKINDPDNDADIIAAGHAQLAAYATWRKEVKTRFPKE